MSFRRRVGSTAFFLLIPLISAITPLIALPAISRSVGAAGWAAIAIAQSFGAGAAIIGELGWSIVGPQLVARSLVLAQAQLFQRAMASKIAVGSLLALGAGTFAGLMAQSLSMVAALVGVASGLGCLNSIWFFIGQNRPIAIVVTDSVPRLLAVTAAAVALHFGAPIIVFPIGLFLGICSSYVLGARAAGTRIFPAGSDFRTVSQTLSRQSTLIGGRAVSSLYTALPIAIVGLVSPQSVAAFAAAERLMRMGLNAVSAIPNRLQHWLGSSPSTEENYRIKASLFINLCVGALSATIFLLAAPFAISVLFAATIALEPVPLVLCSAVILLICTSRGLGLALVAVAKARMISVASILSAVVGTASFLMLAKEFGVSGGFAAEILAEFTGLLVQVLVLFRLFRRS